MDNLIPIILGYFIYSFAMTIVKKRNHKSIIKMLIDNNLIDKGGNNINFNFTSILSDNKRLDKQYILPVALGMMGFSLGLVLGGYLSAYLPKDIMHSYSIKESIQLGTPLFFASIGVIVAYFIEKRNDN